MLNKIEKIAGESNDHLYFFNNQYDDTIVQDSIFEFKNNLYQRAIESQESVIALQRITIPSEELKLDVEINTKYKLPVGTKTIMLKDSTLIIPGGKLWDRKNSTVGDTLRGIAYGNGLYVAVGYYGTILTSPDGITWTARNSETTSTLYNIIYTNNKYVVAGGTILTSPDGITWNPCPSSMDFSMLSVVYGNDQYVAVGEYGFILTSDDGENWFPDTTINGDVGKLTRVTHGNNLYIAVGERGVIVTSHNGKDWDVIETDLSGLQHIDFMDVIYTENQYIVIGSGYTILTSPDGIVWNHISNDISNCSMNSISYDNGQYTIVGTEWEGDGVGVIIISHDGLTWTKVLDNQTMGLYKILHNNGQYIAVGSEGAIVTSQDTEKYIDVGIIPYYNKKQFVDTYGYDTRIPLTDIWYNSDIFNRRVLVYVNDKQTMNLSFIETRNDGVLICADFLNVANPLLLSDTVELIYTTHSDVYYTRKAKTELIINNRIELSKFSIIKKLQKKEKMNSYKIAIGSGPMLDSSNCKLVVENSIEYIEIPSDFVAKIPSGVHNCYIYHDIYKAGSIVFTKTASNSAMLQIPFKNNPIPINNFLIYKLYDDDTKLSNPIDIKIELKYPNIYEFSIVDDGQYSIEWYETTVDNTGIVFDNHLKDYLQYKGDRYANDYTNKLLPFSLLDYRPIMDFGYDYADYVAHEHYGDIRQYNLTKLVNLFNDNTLRYNPYFLKFNNRNRRYIHISTNGILTPDIMTRSVTSLKVLYHYDNNETTTHYNEDTIHTFNEPQTYIKFSNSINYPRAGQVFLDGLRFIPTLIHSTEFETRVYLPKSKIKMSTDIVIDLFYAPTEYEIGKREESIIFHTVGKAQSLPSNASFGNKCGADILFYTELTNSVLDRGIDLGLRVDEYTISHGDYDTKLILGKDQKSYLLTIFEEYYMSSKIEKVLLSKANKVIMADTNNFYKRVKTEDVVMVTPDYSMIGVDIGVTNTDNYRCKYLTSVSQGQSVLVENFRDEPDPYRFRVFYGGVLLEDSRYIVVFTGGYGGTVSFEFISLPPSTDTSLMIEYMPFREYTVLDRVLSPDLYIPGGLIDLSCFIEKPLDLGSTRIYLDGRRISNTHIRQIASNDTIYIMGYSPHMSIRVDIVAHDNEPYDYNRNSWNSGFLINDLIFEDSGFGNYFHENNIISQKITSSSITKIKYLNNKYIVIGTPVVATGKMFIATSADSKNWTVNNTITGTARLNDIIYANNQYVVVGQSGNLLTSPDAITWTKKTVGVNTDISSIAYFKNKYYIVTHNGSLLSSNDATTWTIITFPEDMGDNIKNTAYIASVGDRLIITTAGSKHNKIWSSTNATAWASIGGSNNNRGIASNGEFALVVSHTNISKVFPINTVPITIAPPTPINDWSRISYSNGYFIMGYTGKIALIRDDSITSSVSDKISYMEFPVPDKEIISAVICGNILIASVYNTNEILYIPLFQ